MNTRAELTVPLRPQAFAAVAFAAVAAAFDLTSNNGIFRPWSGGRIGRENINVRVYATYIFVLPFLQTAKQNSRHSYGILVRAVLYDHSRMKAIAKGESVSSKDSAR